MLQRKAEGVKLSGGSSYNAKADIHVCSHHRVLALLDHASADNHYSKA